MLSMFTGNKIVSKFTSQNINLNAKEKIWVYLPTLTNSIVLYISYRLKFQTHIVRSAVSETILINRIE